MTDKILVIQFGFTTVPRSQYHIKCLLKPDQCACFNLCARKSGLLVSLCVLHPCDFCLCMCSCALQREKALSWGECLTDVLPQHRKWGPFPSPENTHISSCILVRTFMIIMLSLTSDV